MIEVILLFHMDLHQENKDELEYLNSNLEINSMPN